MSCHKPHQRDDGVDHVDPVLVEPLHRVSVLAVVDGGLEVLRRVAALLSFLHSDKK